jgi:methylenetetrahydrofolate reductase (NADPH)
MKTESVLEKVLSTGNLAVTSECGPPRGAVRRPCGKGRMLRGVRRRGQCDRQPDGHGAHVEFCRQRDHQADGAPPPAADGHPGPQPAGHAGRHHRRLPHGINTMLCLSGDHTPLRGPSPWPPTFTTSIRSSFSRWFAPCATRASFRAAPTSTTRPKCSSARQPTPLATPSSCGWPAGQESGRRRRLRPDPVHLQHRQIRDVDERGRGPRPPRKMPPGRRDPHEIGGHGPLHEEQGAGHGRSPGNGGPHGRVPKDKQAQEGIDICVETIQRLKEVEGVAGFHIMAIEWEKKGAGNRRAGRALSAPAVDGGSE